MPYTIYDTGNLVIFWLAIPAVVEECLDAWPGTKADSVEVVLEADRAARHQAPADVTFVRHRSSTTQNPLPTLPDLRAGG